MADSSNKPLKLSDSEIALYGSVTTDPSRRFLQRRNSQQKKELTEAEAKRRQTDELKRSEVFNEIIEDLEELKEQQREKVFDATNTMEMKKVQGVGIGIDLALKRIRGKLDNTKESDRTRRLKRAV